MNEKERASIEERLIDTLCAWKKDADRLAANTPAARAAIIQAKELKIWEGRYASFHDWLEAECDITERWAYSLISSAKVIAAIEEVAECSKSLTALRQPEAQQTLRALSPKAINRLRELPPVKAGKAVLAAMEIADGVPTAAQVTEAVKTVAPPVAKPKKRKAEPFENHPVLVAIDNEWVAIQRDLSVIEMKPKEVYKRLREAVKAVL